MRQSGQDILVFVFNIKLIAAVRGTIKVSLRLLFSCHKLYANNQPTNDITFFTQDGTFFFKSKWKYLL